jgi:cyclopropane fatty-acyl-phospholipid synthase-like methyltransferase
MSGVKTLLDLGGGPGSYAVFFCQAHPELRVVTFDLPESAPVATELVGRYGLEHRIDFQGGDYFVDAIAGKFDACLISHILHAHSPAENIVLIKRAFEVLNDGGRLWIHDFIPDASGIEPEFPSVFAIRMLSVTTGGNVYTNEEISSWCFHEGFKTCRWLHFGQERGVSVIEATK